MTKKDSVRYFAGQYIGLDQILEKRCQSLLLGGPEIITPIKPLSILNPDHIDFCFRAKNVKVRFKRESSEPLENWLVPNRKYLEDIIGFSGPEGGILFLVFKKDSVL